MSVSSYKICRNVNGFLEGDALDVAMAVVVNIVVVGFSIRKEDMWVEWNHPNNEEGNGGVGCGGGNDDTINDDWVLVVATIAITFWY